MGETKSSLALALAKRSEGKRSEGKPSQRIAQNSKIMKNIKHNHMTQLMKS